MKPRYSLILPGLLVVAMLAFAAAKVTADFDHHADFSRYHTYSWIGVRAGDSLWQERIQAAVDSQLAAKGWTKVASGGDAAVSAIGRVSERDTIQTFYDGFPGWGWIPEEVGTLTVDGFDGRTKQLIWRGQATETLSSKPEKNEHKLDEAVQKMFKDFPPNSKG